MLGSTLIVASYVLLGIFAVMFLLRSLKMARQPVHLRWELSPVPHEKGKSHYGGSYLEEFEWWTKPREKSLVTEGIFMFQEILFLKSVWENNRRLWWFSFPFHFGMYMLIVAGAVFVLGGLAKTAGLPTPGLGVFQLGVPLVAAVGYGLGAVGAIGLLVARLSDSRLKPFTTPVMLFNLVLLLGVFISGVIALATSNYSLGVLGYLKALLTADMSVELSGVLTAHLALAMIFLAYLPFTQMMHFVAKYFTYHQVRWNDEPMTAGSRMERQVVALLGQPVTWSAAHLKADGKKNWVDIATEETKE